jgi:ABC-type nickel/cobalt efflux system permease component RcnA
MKRLNIIIAVFFLVSSTVLAIGIPMQVNLDFGQWLVLACFVLIGCLEAYLFFNNYIDHVTKEQKQDIVKAWREGHDHGYRQGEYDGFESGQNHAMKEINAG